MTEKCKHCGKSKGDHQAKSLHCPMGRKSRIGYITYDPNKTFESKSEKKEFHAFNRMVDFMNSLPKQDK